MSVSRKELLIVGSIDPIAVEETFTGKLPPHVTIFPWFQLLEPQIPRFSDCLDRIAARNVPLVLRVGEDDLFGVHKNIPVQRIVANAAIRKMHQDIQRIAEQTFGAGVENPEQVGDGYSPHITRVEGREFTEGQQVVLPNIQLITRTLGEKTKVVSSEYMLGDSNEQAST